MNYQEKNLEDFENEEELDIQSSENYPWEYTESHEVWVADFSRLSKKATATKIDQEQEVAEIVLDLDQEEIEEEAQENLSEISEAEVELVPEESEIEIATATAPEEEVEDARQLEVAGDFSWLFASIILLLVLFGGEVVLYFLKSHFFWNEKNILFAIWIWRLALLFTWLFFALAKKHLLREKIVATTLSAFLVGVFLSAIWKIVVIKSVWTWLNLLIEPIWMLLILALVLSLFMKFFKK